MMEIMNMEQQANKQSWKTILILGHTQYSYGEKRHWREEKDFHHCC